MATEEVPTIEEALDAARTLQLVRKHVRGFGSLTITTRLRRGGKRELEARLFLHPNHRRWVKDELAEVVMPAAEVLTRALRGHYSLAVDAAGDDEIRLTLST